MPIPRFVPIIGSGFDAIAGQQQQWANFNANIEQANMQRAAQAERDRQNYLAQIATLQNAAQQRNVENQLAVNLANRNLGLSLGSEAVNQRNIESQLAMTERLAKDRYAAEDRRTEAMSKTGEDRIKMQLAEAFKNIQGSGTALSGQYLTSKLSAEAAEKDAAAAEAALAKLEREQMDLSGITEQSPEQMTRMAKLPTEIKIATREYEKRRLAAEKASADFKATKLRIENKGFELAEPTGTMIHADTGTTFSLGAPFSFTPPGAPGAPGAAASVTNAPTLLLRTPRFEVYRE